MSNCQRTADPLIPRLDARLAEVEAAGLVPRFLHLTYCLWWQLGHELQERGEAEDWWKSYQREPHRYRGLPIHVPGLTGAHDDVFMVGV